MTCWSAGRSQARSRSSREGTEASSRHGCTAGISLDLVGDADEGRRFLRRDIARARLQLAALAGHTERHILRRLGRELALRASTGVVAPQELWPDIQEQRLRHAPPDSTSDAALYAEAAEEAAWVAPAGTPPDSDA